MNLSFVIPCWNDAPRLESALGVLANLEPVPQLVVAARDHETQVHCPSTSARIRRDTMPRLIVATTPIPTSTSDELDSVPPAAPSST